MIYVAGSLRSPRPGIVAEALRFDGFDVFDDWRAPGPEADDHWKAYEQSRSHTFLQALEGHAAQQVFGFDRSWLKASDALVVVLPCGKSAFCEAGYMAWYCHKPVFILLDDAERWDVMFRFFADQELNPGGGIYDNISDLSYALNLL